MVGQGTNGVLTPSNLHWDNLNTRLGIITATPNSALDVNGTIQATRMGLGHTTVAPVARLEVISNVSSGLGGVIADFEDGLGVSRVQIVDDRTIGSIPAGIKNVGDPDGICVWATAGPIKILTGTGGTDALVISQAGNGTLSGSLSVGTTLTVGGTGINNAWVRSLFTAGTNTTYNSTNGSFSISDATIRGKLSAGTGITYSSATGVITNSLPSKWIAYGSTGIYYDAGNVGIGEVAPQQKLHTKIVRQASGVPRISALFENGWATADTNNYLNLRTIAIDWYNGIGEDASMYWFNSDTLGFADNPMRLTRDGDACFAYTLSVGSVAPVISPHGGYYPLCVLYENLSPASVAGFFKNNTAGEDCFLVIENTNGNATLQNHLKFGVANNGDIQFFDDTSNKLLEFQTAGTCRLNDDLFMAANSGAWNTTESKGLYMRYSTNGTQDQAYIQSVTRSSGTLQRLVVQGSETWIGSDYRSTAVSASRGRVNIYGTTAQAGVNGGHQNFFTTASNYPTMSLFNWSNDNSGLFFDTYYDGSAFRSCDAGSNFLIYKFSDRLSFEYNAGTTAGSSFTRKTSFYIPTNGNVQFICPAVGMTGTLTVQGNATCNSNLYGEAVQCNWNFGRTIAGAVSRLISSGPVATDWMAAFNATDATTGARGVIFTRAGVIIGAVRYDAGAVAYLTTSDYRIKKNIRPYGCGLGIIRRLKPCKYDMVEDDSFGEGFIAHELAEVLPHAVSGEKDALNEDGTPDHQSIDKMAVIAPLVVATQQLDRKVSSLETSVQSLGAVDLTALQTENALLKERLDTLQSRFDALLEKLQKSYVI